MKRPTQQLRPAGMAAFSWIWAGQFVSLLASAMTRFALTIWAFQETGQATALALVGFFAFAPTVLFSPLAGALVDRWNRKLVLILSDLAAGLATVALLLLYNAGELQLWHLYVANAFAGTFEAFQFPAFSAAMSLMVPQQHYGRANGLVALTEAATGVAAPLLAGLLLAWIGLHGVLAIDVVTFVLAVAGVLLVTVPQPQRSEEGRAAAGGLWAESFYGFRYIWERKGLLGVQLTFAISNFFSSSAMVLVAPLVLARTQNSELQLGTVQSALGLGGLAGGLLMSVWGGPKRRIHGVLLGFIGSSLLGIVPLGLGQGLWIWAAGAFLAAFFIPLINGSNQALWQAKVAPDVQGRVFAARRLIAQLSGPPGLLLAGLLADSVFEPAMQGRLGELLGPLFGTGPGAGIGLLVVLAGLLGISAGAVGYAIPAIRRVDNLPDHNQASP